jgi:hypothetical protein
VTGEWRKLHGEELHNLYSFPNIIRQMKSSQMRWAGHMACMGEKCPRFWWESAPKGRNETTRKLRRPKRRWEDGIRMDFNGD